MERLQAKGELDEEELRALEMDVTGKVWHSICRFTIILMLIGQIMLASWRGARLEVIQVLREVVPICVALNQATECHEQVVDNVLKESNQSDVVLYNRARVRFLSYLESEIFLMCVDRRCSSWEPFSKQQYPTNQTRNVGN